jgi:hypothetical protein
MEENEAQILPSMLFFCYCYSIMRREVSLELTKEHYTRKALFIMITADNLVSLVLSCPLSYPELSALSVLSVLSVFLSW